MEVSAKEGHIIGLDITEHIQKGLSAKETIDKIHSHSGIAIAAHPYDIYRRGVKDLILKLDFDAVEVVNGHTFTNSRDPETLCRQGGIPMVGGSDAHALEEVGSVTVEFEGQWKHALANSAMVVNSKPRSKLLYTNIKRMAKKGDIMKSVKSMAKRHISHYK